MAITLSTLTQPPPGADYRAPSPHRRIGIVLAVVGLLVAVVSLIANIGAGQQLADGEEFGSTLAWSFGLTTTAFATIKIAIAVILVGILVRIWFRWDSMRQTLPKLQPNPTASAHTGDFDSPYGPALATTTAPKELPIHRMARILWMPMLVMGAMLVGVGLITSLVWANNASDGASVITAAAWTQGLQFLGEAFILSGISFLLGSILGLIRRGGGEVQEGLGLTIKTLRMPGSSKAFIGLMMLGLMVGIAQFVLYIYSGTLTDPLDIASGAAWLGPFRELSLGLLLSGIVLALATIARALGFQAWRVREILTTGQ